MNVESNSGPVQPTDNIPHAEMSNARANNTARIADTTGPSHTNDKDSDASSDTCTNGSNEFELKPRPTPLSWRRRFAITNFFRAYSKLDSTALRDVLLPDFKYYARPTAPSDRCLPLNRSQFAQYATEMFLDFKQMQVWPEHIHQTANESIIVVQARMEARVKKSEMPYGHYDWEHETCMVFRMSADGWRIRELKEYVSGPKASDIKRWHAQAKGDYYGGMIKTGAKWAVVVIGITF
ncbi:hypothetical protein N0V88_007296 [Collariella sp. IMI 366227]|nr:hypothetical protein N0V88_007296 [Collariella sp. IMI 366227]